MNINRILKHDFVTTLIIGVLLLIGTLVIYGATFNTAESSLLIKQLVLITVGISIYFLIIAIDIEWFKIFSLQMLLYVFIIGTLVYVNVFGSTIAGTNRWIDFGFFAFQPSEYAKILIILFISLVFSKEVLPVREKLTDIKADSQQRRTIRQKFIFSIRTLLENKDFRASLWVGAYTLPIIFLTFIQPALGNSIIIILLTLLTTFFSLKNQWSVIVVILYSVLFSILVFDFIHFDVDSGVFMVGVDFASYMLVAITLSFAVFMTLLLKTKLWQVMLVFVLVASSVIFGIFAWNNILGDYQRERVLTFVAGPESDPLGSGFQIIQSKIAIGSGQLLGRGYLRGTQSSLHILTQAHTDFAFASMSEQFGFVGALLLLGIYVLLILRILRIAKETKSDFGKNFCFGAVSLLLIHIFINVGMNIGKLPVTGIPLPLVSYGGSSVLMTLIILGIVQSIYASRRPVDMADSLMITSLRGKEID